MTISLAALLSGTASKCKTTTQAHTVMDKDLFLTGRRMEDRIVGLLWSKSHAAPNEHLSRESMAPFFLLSVYAYTAFIAVRCIIDPWRCPTQGAGLPEN